LRRIARRNRISGIVGISSISTVAQTRLHIAASLSIAAAPLAANMCAPRGTLPSRCAARMAACTLGGIVSAKAHHRSFVAVSSAYLAMSLQRIRQTKYQRQRPHQKRV